MWEGIIREGIVLEILGGGGGGRGGGGSIKNFYIKKN